MMPVAVHPLKTRSAQPPGSWTSYLLVRRATTQRQHSQVVVVCISVFGFLNIRSGEDAGICVCIEQQPAK